MTGSNRTAAPRLLQLARAAGAEPAPDADLLARFVRDREEAAFAALVERHGPMVLGVCRRVLGGHHAAEDAFQATFLALARGAARVRDPRAVAAWLYGAAVRVALKARRNAARSAAVERAAPRLAAGDLLAEITGRELASALDEELARLPESFRAAVALCCLEGLSQDEAAHRLGCSPGAVKGRLERGREQLRQRLARRGVALPTALALLAASDAAAFTPPDLFEKTVTLVGAGTASPAVAGLARAVAPTGALPKLAAVALLAVAAGLAVAFGGAEPPKPAPPAEPKVPATAEKPAACADRFGDPLPPSAVARLGTVRQRHGRASGVWFAPDGKAVRTFGDGPAVRTWDAATGKLLDDKILPVYYRADLSRVNEPGGSTGGYSRDVANAVSADGRVLATRSEEFDLQRFYDLTDGKLLAEVKIDPPAWSEHAVLSANGTLLVTCDQPEGGDDRRYVVRAFDVKAGAVKVLFRSKDRFWSIFPTPDGRRVVLARTTMNEGRGAECWDVEGGKRVWQVDGGFPMCGLSDDGKMFVGMAGFADGVQGWDAETGKPAAGLRLPTLKDIGDMKFPISMNNMRVGLHGNLLTMTSSSERVVWDAAAGRLACRLPGGYGAVALAPDGKSLVTAGETLQRWDSETGEMLWPDTRDDGHAGLVRGVKFAAGGRVLVSTGSDTTLRVWDVPTASGKVLDRGGQKYLTTAAPTADGKFVLTRRPDGAGPDVISVIETATGKEARSIPLIPAAEGSSGHPVLYHIALTPDGETAVGVLLVRTAEDGRTGYAVARWDLATGKYLGRRLLPAGGGGYPLSPDQRYALTSNTPYDCALFDVRTGATLSLQFDKRNLVRRRGPVVSPDGRLAAAPTDNGKDPPGEVGVTVWEVATGARVDRLPAGTGMVRFTPDGRGLLAADLKGVGLWDLASRERVAWHPAHTAVPGDGGGRTFVSDWDVTPDGKTLATGHADGTILLWDVALPARPAAPALAAADLDRLWADVSAVDAAKAYRAGWELAARPDQAVNLLRGKVAPVPAADDAVVARLVAQLAVEEFADREAAEKELRELGPAVAPALRKVLAAGAPTPEQRDRIVRVLAGVTVPALPTAAEVPALRAIAVLERAGTKDARDLLDRLAGGVPDARLTREAKEALLRFQRAEGTRAPANR